MDTFLSTEATHGAQTTVYRLLVNTAQDEFHSGMYTSPNPAARKALQHLNNFPPHGICSTCTAKPNITLP